MPCKSNPYQVEKDVSEEEIDILETEKLLEGPDDCYYFVYCTFFIIGITSVLPGSFFTVANKYWMYKFRNTKSETQQLNPLQVSYTAYAALASTIPLPICFIVNIFIHEKISCQKRIIGSLIIMLILSFITLVFIKIDTNLWQNGFLGLTLSTIVIFNTACGILISTISGIVFNFSSKYITSFTMGQSAGGAFSALAEIASLAIAASPTLNGLIYSVIGCFTIFIALTTNLILPKNLYFKHFMFEENENGISEFENDLVGQSTIISYKLISIKIWQYVFCACLGTIVYGSVQPGVTVLIKSYGTGIWSERYFLPVMTFLLPTVTDGFGRFASVVIDWPKNWYVLLLLNVIRMVVMPIVLFCNLQPRGNLPVIFNSDAYFIVFQAVAGFTNGYVLNIAQINIPRVLDDHEKYSGGLVLGIFSCLASNVGSAFSTLIVKII